MKAIDMKKIIVIISAALLLAACNGYNSLPLFEDSYVYFNTAKSGFTNINELGKSTTSYYINYVGPMEEGESIDVQFSVSAGDGLAEGVDYQMVTTENTLSFSPGVYSLGIHIRWLAHEIDPDRDNTVTLRIEGCSKEGVILGLPGPAAKDRSVTITKFKNE